MVGQKGNAVERELDPPEDVANRAKNARTEAQLDTSDVRCDTILGVATTSSSECDVNAAMASIQTPVPTSISASSDVISIAATEPGNRLIGTTSSDASLSTSCQDGVDLESALVSPTERASTSKEACEDTARLFGYLTAKMIDLFRSGSKWKACSFSNKGTSNLQSEISGSFEFLPIFLQQHKTDGGRLVEYQNTLKNGQWRFRVICSTSVFCDHDASHTKYDYEIAEKLSRYLDDCGATEVAIDSAFDKLGIQYDIPSPNGIIIKLPPSVPSLEAWTPTVGGRPAVYDGCGSMHSDPSLVTFCISDISPTTGSLRLCNTIQGWLDKHGAGVLLELWTCYRNIDLKAQKKTRRLRNNEVRALVSVRESYDNRLKVKDVSIALRSLPGYILVDYQPCKINYLWRYPCCSICQPLTTKDRHLEQDCPCSRCMKCFKSGHIADNCTLRLDQAVQTERAATI